MAADTSTISPPRVRVLGFPVTGLTMDECLGLLVDWASECPEDAPRAVYTANPEMLWAARRDQRLARALDGASLLVPDGVGVVGASRLLGSPLPGRLPGVEILGGLLEAARHLPLHPYFLGAREDVTHKLASRLPRLFAGIRPAGFHHGYFDLDDDRTVDGIVQDITRSGANLLVVGMGVPRDQYFIHGRGGLLPGVGLAIGVGGSLDILAGEVARAPAWMRTAGLEWLYRLASSPSRLPRQAALPLFAAAVVGQAVSERLIHRRTP